jgi:hypothetical protein
MDVEEIFIDQIIKHTDETKLLKFSYELSNQQYTISYNDDYLWLAYVVTMQEKENALNAVKCFMLGRNSNN